MNKVVTKLWKIELLIILVIILVKCVSCSHKAGEIIFAGKNHYFVLGKNPAPIYKEYFKKGDTILARKNTLVVKNAKRLNRKISYYEQGYKNPSMRKLKRKFIHNCTKIK